MSFLFTNKKKWKERKLDIDAEIKTRVEAAGGQHDDVEIRISLLWNNLNDLDLHVITPSGEEIYYGNKKSQCGGWLDVDMNVQGETAKPVENVFWATGSAPSGRYRIYVQNYHLYEQDTGETEFRVEVRVRNEIHHFDGVISPNGETGVKSNMVIYEFDYSPATGSEASPERDIYTRYSDTAIRKQWESILPLENILSLEEAKGIVDVMLGAICLVEGTRNLDEYIDDMRIRGQSQQRCEQTQGALRNLAKVRHASSSTLGGYLSTSPTRKLRGGKLKRI